MCTPAPTNLTQIDTNHCWISEGTYKPVKDASWSAAFSFWDRTFAIKKGVALIGGFSGVEVSVEEANATLYKVVLSGDFNTDSINNVNAYSASIVTCLSENSISLIGLAIEGGKGSQGSAVNHKGGGALRIEKCLITGNEGGLPNFAGNGGCIYSSGRLHIVESNFTDNVQALVLTGASSGTPFKATILQCNFLNNSGQRGACILVSGSSSGKDTLDIDRCMFSGNQASHQTNWGGAGIAVAVSTSPIFQDQVDVVVKNSIFSGNLADYGSAIYATKPSVGGFLSDKATLTVINCTFSGNRDVFAHTSGSLFCELSKLDIHNSIFWNNSTDIFSNFTSTSISHSIVEDGCTGSCTNVFSSDPLFVFMPGTSEAPTILGNFSLNGDNSSAVDIGHAGVNPSNVDYAGFNRTSGSGIDAGALEFQQQLSGSIEQVSFQSVKIYPNPCDTYTMLESHEPIESISMLNAQGSLIYEQRLGLSTTHRINWQELGLASGIYYVQILTHSGKMESLKVLVGR
jgi:hypothetical protein